jgi:hypothetical protein
MLAVLSAGAVGPAAAGAVGAGAGGVGWLVAGAERQQR